MKTLIIGASGKIGRFIINSSNRNYILTYNKNKISDGIHFDITKDNLSNILKKFSINKIVLLSAISNPDECYINKNHSNMINVIKTKKLIDEIVKKKIYFIFFSSECVFCGTKGNYSEKSFLKPRNVYGFQKYLIEKYIKKKTKNYAILRLATIYGDQLNDKTLISNFLSDLIKGKRKFEVAVDQKFNPLYIKDLERILKEFLKTKIKGLYNVGGTQQLSRYECIKKITEQLKTKKKNEIILNKAKLSSFKTIDKQALNKTMNTNKLSKRIKIKMNKFENVAKKMIMTNYVNEKLFKRS